MTAALTAFLVLLCAQEPEQIGLDIGVSSIAVAPKVPQLKIRARTDVKYGIVSLHRSDGKAVVIKLGRIPAGAERSYPLDQPVGQFHYEGTLVATFVGSDESSMPLAFDAA